MKHILTIVCVCIACIAKAQLSPVVLNGPDPKTHIDSSCIVIISQTIYLMGDGTKRHSWEETNLKGEVLDSGNDFEWHREQNIELVNNERRNKTYYSVLVPVCGNLVKVLLPPRNSLNHDVDMMVRHYFGLSYWD